MPEIFFIRGHAKSGTNWLGNLMNLHPSINIRGEFHFENLFKGLEETFSAPWGILSKWDPDLVSTRFYKMIEDLIVDFCGDNDFCGDRTPGGIIESYIPGKKCLYISRDGRDVLVSWTFHAFRLALHTSPELLEKQKLFNHDPNYFENHKSELLDLKKYVKGFAKEWNDIILRDFNHMKMADEGTLNLRYYHIKYEDLHANTDLHRKKIYKFLGLDPTPASPLGIKTVPGFGRIDNLSLNRRGEAGSWREYFTDKQRLWFEEEAAEALNLLGFK